jgi:hypothetical protein
MAAKSPGTCGRFFLPHGRVHDSAAKYLPFADAKKGRGFLPPGTGYTQHPLSFFSAPRSTSLWPKIVLSASISIRVNSSREL